VAFLAALATLLRCLAWDFLPVVLAQRAMRLKALMALPTRFLPGLPKALTALAAATQALALLTTLRLNPRNLATAWCPL